MKFSAHSKIRRTTTTQHTSDSAVSHTRTLSNTHTHTQIAFRFRCDVCTHNALADKIPSTNSPSTLKHTHTQSYVFICKALHTFQNFQVLHLFFSFNYRINGIQEFLWTVMVSDEQVKSDRWIPRWRKGIGGRTRWGGSEVAATPFLEWKHPGGDSVGGGGGAVAAVSARKLAASLWQLAATTNGDGSVRWQCGLSFDRLGFEVLLYQC